MALFSSPDIEVSLRLSYNVCIRTLPFGRSG
jgi:hypothetical protein